MADAGTTTAGTITKDASDRHTEVLNGIKIHYNELGDPTHPALFTFHGGGPGANAWGNTRFCAPQLSAHFHLIMMDLPGYGESDMNLANWGGDPGDVFWDNCILGVMDQLGIARAHLYGSSSSVTPCYRMGIDHPDRVGKIVAQSMGVGRSSFLTPQLPGIPSFRVFGANPTRETMAVTMHHFIPKTELCTDELIDERLAAALLPGHLDLRGRIPEPTRVEQEIAKLDKEVLVVWGNDDRMVAPEGALTALWQLPNARLHMWGGGTGHFVAYEHAEEFSNLVIDFLTH